MLHKYRHTGPPRGPATWTRMFAWCPLFPPFYLCFVSCDVLHERAGHTGHLYYFLPDAVVLPPPSLNPHSSPLPGFRSLYPCLVIYPSYELFLGVRFSSCLHWHAHSCHPFKVLGTGSLLLMTQTLSPSGSPFLNRFRAPCLFSL